MKTLRIPKISTNLGQLGHIENSLVLSPNRFFYCECPKFYLNRVFQSYRHKGLGKALQRVEASGWSRRPASQVPEIKVVKIIKNIILMETILRSNSEVR